ncbi:MAG: hypothetical protein ABS75_27355 [Pelagibacterium sp. SCN 63-23]|nr:MAG: hypothetical protein ABS75_27355 [Pelagibacterium sp. SCN 63-23]
MPQRFAVYYAPAITDILWDRASAWLGRDPASGLLFEGAVAGMERKRLLDLTQSAARYGFHATIKPPMALAPNCHLDQLKAAVSDLVASAAPVSLGRLRIASLDGFLALVPAEDGNASLQDFAARVVEDLDPFRAPLSPRDQAARAARGLSPRQLELLGAYGYPYVFDQFRFHMTLTDRLAPEDFDEVLDAARTWFGPVLDRDIVLDRLVLFHEPERGTLFRRLGDYELRA